MAYLVLVRHGQSEWNAKGLWTGQTDVPLTEQGRAEARDAANHLQDISLDKAYTSGLVRSQQTLQEILQTLHLTQPETVHTVALNERNYGDYQGKNKWQVKDQIGEDAFNKIRREWNHPVPGGETLKDVYQRVLPYYEQNILDDLKHGKNVIVVAHGNPLRAIVKYLENIDNESIHKVEIGTGEVRVYEIDADGNVTAKQVRQIGTPV